MKKSLLIICILLFAISITFFGFYFLSADRISKSTQLFTEIMVKPDNTLQWVKIPKSKRIKGVALVVHGLNLKPERMQSVIVELNDAGIDVLNLSLRGHGDNYRKNATVSAEESRLESFRAVTCSLWLAEIYEAYLKVRKRASKDHVPVYFIGYSIGGLLGCDLLLRHPDVYYDRMVLFAPALNITMESYLLKPLLPFPNIIIDSLAPIYYRANKGTPMAAYKALFEAVEYFEKNANEKLNKPTLIFIDEKDEFVSSVRLNEIIARRSLDHWRINIVQKDNDIEGKISYHLIIDGESVGKQMWNQIKDALKRHFSIKSSV